MWTRDSIPEGDGKINKNVDVQKAKPPRYEPGVFEIVIRLEIYTSQGVVVAEPGDWIVATRYNVTVYEGPTCPKKQ